MTVKIFILIMKLYVYKKNWSISMLSKILTLFFIGSFSLAAYNVGDTVSITDQQREFDVCHGLEPNGETDGVFSLYDYNGDYNGGTYYVFHIDMAASW